MPPVLGRLLPRGSLALWGLPRPNPGRVTGPHPRLCRAAARGAVVSYVYIRSPVSLFPLLSFTLSSVSLFPSPRTRCGLPPLLRRLPRAFSRGRRGEGGTGLREGRCGMFPGSSRCSGQLQVLRAAPGQLQVLRAAPGQPLEAAGPRGGGVGQRCRDRAGAAAGPGRRPGAPLWHFGKTGQKSLKKQLVVLARGCVKHMGVTLPA